MVEKYLEYCDSSWGRFRLYTIYNNIVSALTPNNNCKSFLDIGCGPAHIVQYLASLFSSGVAIDSSEDMIRAIFHRDPKINYYVSSFEDFNPDEKFDLILCHNVLEYQDEKKLFLTKIVRCLRNKDSFLSIVFINRSKEILQCLRGGFFSEAKKLHDKGLYYSRTFKKVVYLPSALELENLLEECGLNIIIKRGIGILYPRDYKDSTMDEITRIEMDMQNDPNMLINSTLIHFICRRLSI